MENEQPNLNPIPPHKSVSHWVVVALAIVAVVGYFMASYAFGLWPFGGLIPPVSMLTPTPTPATAVSLTEGWKTYTNTEYGFEFKYPGDWIVEKLDKVNSQEIISIRQKDDDGAFGAISVHREDGIFVEEESLQDLKVLNKSEVDYNGIIWKIFITADTREELLQFINTFTDTNRDSPVTYSLGGRYYKDREILYNQILSTFRFLDQPDTSTWQTYTNTKYGYQIMYPSSVNVSANEEGFAVVVPDSENVMSYASLLIGPPQATKLTDISQLVLPECARNIQSIYVGIVKAVQFDGCDMAQPPQVIWIGNGKLYNAISYNNLDVALQILSTFKFIDAVDTSTWQIYTNTEYGFEFKYPGDWVVDEVSDIFLSVYAENDKPEQTTKINYGPAYSIDITIWDNPKKYTLENWFNNEFGKDEVFSKENIKINGQDAIKASLAGEISSSTIFFKLPNNYIVDFNIIHNFPHTSIYNQILSTFRFTK